MYKYFISWAFIALACYCHAQKLILTDAETGTPLVGATVQIVGQDRLAITDVTGTADLSPFGDFDQVQIRMIGYEKRVLSPEELTALDYNVTLQLTGVALEELVISASKFDEIQTDVVQKIQVMRKSELQQMNQTSMADVLSQSGNIVVQKSQQGGGSPIIRGFETNKVLIVVDGVRMNNAIYRGGHLQNVITLDNAIMDRVEVVFGPGSVMYGSDALGGVMHFYTKNPTLSNGNGVEVHTNAYQRYFSAANGLASHGDISVGGKRWGSLSSFTYSKYGDLEQGANRKRKYADFGSRSWYVKRINGQDSTISNRNPDKQVGSAYSQIDLLQKVMFKPNSFTQHLINLQYSTSSDVPRYDRLTQVAGGSPRFGDWFYGPQKRFFSAYSLALSRSNAIYDMAKFTVGYQQIEESRIDRRFKSDQENNRIEDVAVWTANADLIRILGSHEISYGVEFTYNDVNSNAFERSISTGSETPLDTRYPDGGSIMKSAAAYLTHKYEVNEKIVFNDGLRLSYVGLSARFRDKTFFPFPFNSIDQDHLAPSGNLGISVMPGSGWRFTGNVSSGFRAPNVDDLTKVFESVQGRIIVPNPDLKPEYTLNSEFGIAKTIMKRINVSSTVYYTALRNVITVLPSTFNGMDSVDYDGQLSQVTTSKNASRAYIYGFESSIAGNVTSIISVRGSLNYTFGRIRTDSSDYPLDHIPPLFGKLNVIATTGKFKNEVFTQFSGQKKVKDYNMIGEDNFSFATPDGMPAWVTVNFRSNWQVTKMLNVQIACENILDQNYRVFASNISAPGRNWIITLRATL